MKQFHCDHNVTGTVFHQQDGPGSIVSLIGSEPEVDIQLKDALGPSLRDYSWGLLGGSVWLDHWGSNRNREVGQDSHELALTSRQTKFLITELSEQRSQAAAQAICRAKLVTLSGQRAQLEVLSDLVPN